MNDATNGDDLNEVKRGEKMIRHGIVVEAGGERAVVQLTRHAA